MVLILAFDNKLADMLGGPLPEAGAHMGFYAVAHRDNGVEIIKILIFFDLLSPFILNY